MTYHLLHGPNTFAPISEQERWLVRVEAMPKTPETKAEIERVTSCIERAKARVQTSSQ